MERHKEFVYLRSMPKIRQNRAFYHRSLSATTTMEMGQMTLFFAHQFLYTGGRSYLNGLYAFIRLVHDLFHPLIKYRHVKECEGSNRMIQMQVSPHCDCCGLPINPQTGEDCPRCKYPVNFAKEERF